MLRVGEVNPADPKAFDLLILGSPTHGGFPTSDMDGLRKALPALEGVNIAVLDTWTKTTIFGYAASRIARSLERKGRNLVAPPEGFLVLGIHGLQAVLREKLYGVYLYGAWAFPEGTARGDVDFHVILRGPLNDAEKSALSGLHATLAQEHPSLVGEGLDGYYILLDEAHGQTPPRHQLLEGAVDSSWALHRAHIRAGRCIVLYGPDPREVYLAASWAELATALQGELDYVEEHLADYPAY